MEGCGGQEELNADRDVSYLETPWTFIFCVHLEGQRAFKADPTVVCLLGF